MSHENLLRSITVDVVQSLLDFASGPLFAETLALAFGAPAPSLAVFRSALTQLPVVEVLPDEVLFGALGAFSAQTGKIYLSVSVVNGDAGRLRAVYLEEIGHYLDSVFNTQDAMGDEGAIFSKLMQGNSLDMAILDTLRAENDQAAIIVNGKIIEVEQANFMGTDGNDNIVGTSERDIINALGGNDTINGNSGFDNINGGPGIDILIADYSSHDTSRGITNYFDRIVSNSATLLSFASIEKLNITGSQNDDSLSLQRADDTLDGGVGNDTLVLNLANVTSSVNVNFSNTQNQVTYGNVSVKNFEYVGGLTLGIGDDTVQLAGIAATSQGSIDSSGGTDTLIVNYSNYSSGIVNGSDSLRSKAGGLLYFSNIEKFEITATQFNDILTGKNNNDILVGLGGSDVLKGNNGNDILIGTHDGSQERDTLEGGTGKDLFILANTTKTFYDDISDLPGVDDYAVIADLSPNYDTIQLRGSSADYLLTVSGSDTNLYTYKSGTEPDELIAIIKNHKTLSLNASYFSYVSSPTLPSITLAVAPARVTEDGAINLVYTFTRTEVATTALTVNYTVAGSATLGTDYTGIAATPAVKTVTFAANSSTVTVTVDPTANTTIESNETVALTLATGTGYSIGTTAAVVGTILNDDVTSLNTYTMRANDSSLLLLGTKRINGIGNDLNNIIRGNSNSNKILGFFGADVLTGGGKFDSDLFAYNSLDESLLGASNSFDVITDFSNRDSILAPISVETDRLVSPIGNIMTLSASTVSSLLSTVSFAANSVAAFTASGRLGTFIAMNDGRDGYQAESDAIIFLQNYVVSSANFVNFT